MVVQMRILLVEDDLDLAESLVDVLELEGYEVQHESQGDLGLVYLQSASPDIVILDWDLPVISGLDLMRQYRSAGGNVPIIMLTGKSDLDSKYDGLWQGADDYLTKPFIVDELLARLKAIYRRPKAILPERVLAGELIIETHTRSVSLINGSLVKLSKMEYAVLEFFLSNPDKLFSSKDLLDSVWESEKSNSEDSVRTCIKKLRRKIADSNGDCIIETVRHSGYIYRTKPSQEKS